MKDTYLQTLRPLIHQACPELLELSFGAHVEVLGGKLRRITDVLADGWIMVDRYKVQRFSPDEYTLLGHPIRLSHVLRVLKVRRNHTETYAYGIDNSGHFLQCRPDSEWEWVFVDHAAIYWSLSSDRLEDQSEETLKWLCETLSN
ncbi:hypothetical protein [Dongia sp.]|uniref:hypothetical protein n=1 Tax=Dongia sp. TaxID=1977262 RepID=UPI003752BF45